MSQNNMGDMEFKATSNSVIDAASKATTINSGIDNMIGSKNNTLIQKNRINLEQEIAIADKQKLFLTRSRMLQISMDKNAYKTKIIYTLLAIILFIFIATLGIYTFSLKKVNK